MRPPQPDPIAGKPVPSRRIAGDARRFRFRLVMAGGVVLLAASALTGITLGSAKIPLNQVAWVLWAKLLPSGWVDLSGVRQVDQIIVWLVRVPRVCLAGVVGAMLALAGVQLQGLFRNPLAAPGIIGTSQGAAFGAIIAIATGLAMRSVLYLPLVAFLGAFCALLIIASLAAREGRTSIGTLLLAGVALNFLITAGISLIISFAFKDIEVAIQMMAWMMGGLEGRSWLHVGIAAPCLLAGLLLSRWFARDLDLMLEGDDSARSLGVATERVTLFVLIITALLTAGAVAVSGVVGFVGLVVPHLVRLLVGPAHRTLNWASALTGAWLLILADLIARTIHRPEEIRLGIVTACIGAPFFLFLLIRYRREAALL